MRVRTGHLIGAVVILLTFAGLVPVCRAAAPLTSTERQLLAVAPKILQYARDQGAASVGVLKFRIKQGKRPATDRLGVLNSMLADRLELALIMKNPVSQPVAIIHDASAVASKLSGASHLTPEGRALLFDADYPLAWGGGKGRPDLFVTGAVLIPDDLSRMTVSVQAFTKNSDLVEIARFDARPGVTEVIESGGSFSRGGLFNQPGLTNVALSELAPPVQEAASVLQGKMLHPLVDPKSPFALDIQYDGRSQKIEVRDGRAFVAEPAETQKVTLFVRRRNPNDQKRYAVVVKVNGENTLYRERVPEQQCHAWTLEPGRSQLEIRGFAKQGNLSETFRVLSKKESEAKAIDYGRDAGLISLVVFAERDASNPPPTPNLLDEDAEDFAVLAAGTFPKDPLQNLGALKHALVTASTRGTGSRGLVIAGDVQKSNVQTVAFERDPTPIFSASVIYYGP